LTFSILELAHQGHDAKPFLPIGRLQFRRGEWAYLRGESGCGKSSFLKALNRLWPYGQGNVVFPDGVRTFYAAQEVRLPPVSLKELVCLPHRADEHSDAAAAAALHKAGLGEFIENLADTTREGKGWDQVLSGGQKQKLIVARILLQKPGLVFLDEATSALDPEGKSAFHQALKDHCPNVTVISVMHEAVPPRSATGEEFYNSVVTFADGVATKKPLDPLPSEITKILARPPAMEESWLRIPRLRLKQK
ncbi:MAG: ABC transporter ATP-binding protein, partial [Proteobacteria bacterium]